MGLLPGQLCFARDGEPFPCFLTLWDCQYTGSHLPMCPCKAERAWEAAVILVEGSRDWLGAYPSEPLLISLFCKLGTGVSPAWLCWQRDQYVIIPGLMLFKAKLPNFYTPNLSQLSTLDWQDGKLIYLFNFSPIDLFVVPWTQDSMHFVALLLSESGKCNCGADLSGESGFSQRSYLDS